MFSDFRILVRKWSFALSQKIPSCPRIFSRLSLRALKEKYFKRHLQEKEDMNNHLREVPIIQQVIAQKAQCLEMVQRQH